MPREIGPGHERMFLFPPALDDWVSEDHPARFIRDFVECLDLDALGIKKRTSNRGRSSYSRELLLMVWVYGYMERIYSTRQLEKACRDQISLLWLTGNNAPDHNTLWRFWKKNRGALKRLFKHSVRLAAEAGMVGLVVHAVDGTKIRAQASADTAYHRKKLEEALTRIEKSIDQMESEVEHAERTEIGEYRLPDKLVDAKKRKEFIKQALKDLEEAETNHQQPAEPDARMMKCEGRVVFAYNGQAVVDEDSGLIVAEDVGNGESDTGQLAPMIEQVEENLGAAADTTLGDKGYSAGSDLKEADEKGFNVLVNLKKNVSPPEDTEPYHASRFSYDEKNDVVICPEGQELVFEREKRSRQGDEIGRLYRCRHKKDCPVSHLCTSDKRGRSILITEAGIAVAKQRAKHSSKRNQEVLKKRGAIVEPVFGQIKHNQQFRKWTVRGLSNVATQWALICTVFNLRKLYSTWVANPKTAFVSGECQILLA